MLVAVGSKNPTKIGSVQDIFRIHFPNSQIKGITVDSEVSDQPLTDEEMYQGALNRARKALKLIKNADYGVGIEGGLHKRSYGWFEHSLVVIVNQQGRIGVGASGGLVLPEKVIVRIHQGETLEQAIDALFGTKKIGEGIGMFGIMTNEVVTRRSGVSHGVAFALAPFLHPDIYFQDCQRVFCKRVDLEVVIKNASQLSFFPENK